MFSLAAQLFWDLSFGLHFGGVLLGPIKVRYDFELAGRTIGLPEVLVGRPILRWDVRHLSDESVVSQAQIGPIGVGSVIPDQVNGSLLTDFELLLFDDFCVQLVQHEAHLKELSEKPQYVKFWIRVEFVHRIILKLHFVEQAQFLGQLSQK